jgi:hypothetical protein
MSDIEARLAAFRQEIGHATKPSGSARTESSKIALIEAARGDIARFRTEGWTWRAIADSTRESLNASPELIRQTIQNKLKRNKKLALTARKQAKAKPAPQVAPVRTSVPASVPDEPFGPTA